MTRRLHREIAEMGGNLQAIHVCRRGAPGPLQRLDYEFIHAALKHIHGLHAALKHIHGLHLERGQDV